MKKPHCFNRFVYLFVFISLSREVGMLVMHISANQVPIKDNDTDTFWGTSHPCHLQGWQKPKFPSHSCCQGSPALMPVQFVLQPGFCLFLSLQPYFFTVPYLTPYAPATLKYSQIYKCVIIPFASLHLCGSSCLEPGYFLLILQDSLSIYPN